MNSVPLWHERDNIDIFSREQPYAFSPMVNESSSHPIVHIKKIITLK